jgi:hypothetical protein
MRVRRKYDTTTAMKIDCIQRGAFNSCINTIQNLIEADNINKKREAKIKKQKAVKKKPVKKKLVVQVTDRFSDLEH